MIVDRTLLTRALIALADGDAPEAVAVVTPVADLIVSDTRRLAISSRVASLLGAAAELLGHHKVAAIHFGFAAAEWERLEITLRAADRPVVERAIANCRTALGEERYVEFTAQGATRTFGDLPAVDTGFA